MLESPIIGSKLVTYLAVPLTLTVGPAVGVAIVAACGAACLGGYLLLDKSLAKRAREQGSTLAIPPI